MTRSVSIAKASNLMREKYRSERGERKFRLMRVNWEIRGKIRREKTLNLTQKEKGGIR